MLCEKQPASSRIWTRVAVSIFYDDNHNTTDKEYSEYDTKLHPLLSGQIDMFEN